AGRRGRRVRQRRGPRPAVPRHPAPAAARADDALDALLRGSDAVRDRRANGHEPDARLAAAAGCDRRSERAARLRSLTPRLQPGGSGYFQSARKEYLTCLLEPRSYSSLLVPFCGGPPRSPGTPTRSTGDSLETF